jgi:trimethylamine--corrinoid protein Co-methyltransferase
MFIPKIMDRGFLSLEKDPVARDMRKRARKHYVEAMGRYTPPNLPEDIETKLDAIMNG